MGDLLTQLVGVVEFMGTIGWKKDGLAVEACRWTLDAFILLYVS